MGRVFGQKPQVKIKKKLKLKLIIADTILDKI